MTDGDLLDAAPCSGLWYADPDCRVVEATVELAGVVEVSYIKVRDLGDAAPTVAISTDGVTFTPLTEVAPLPAPVPARYVRAGGDALAQISVFAAE